MDDRQRHAFYPFVVVRIACRVCSHNGAYRLPRLAAKFGPDRPPRPPRSVFKRLPVASGGAWQAGRFSVRRLPAGPRPASAPHLPPGSCACASWPATIDGWPRRGARDRRERRRRIYPSKCLSSTHGAGPTMSREGAARRCSWCVGVTRAAARLAGDVAFVRGHIALLISFL
jgi:hypothetical protein